MGGSAGALFGWKQGETGVTVEEQCGVVVVVKERECGRVEDGVGWNAVGVAAVAVGRVCDRPKVGIRTRPWRGCHKRKQEVPPRELFTSSAARREKDWQYVHVGPVQRIFSSLIPQNHTSPCTRTDSVFHLQFPASDGSPSPSPPRLVCCGNRPDKIRPRRRRLERDMVSANKTETTTWLYSCTLLLHVHVSLGLARWLTGPSSLVHVGTCTPPPF
ncbi:hypothetical protein IWZ00DRAFT_241746 [Phyllosticta capitalensis]|uniref:uncharacterized protein n=1 Tax=Phyllosticta capitalensis TaxID=121624 RepID=UPI0031328F8D